MKSGIYLTAFTIIIGVFSLNTAPASIVTNGLVSYWTFDKGSIVNKNVKDVWGDNNGKIIGNPKVVPGQVGEALEFNGAGDFVNLTTLGDFGRQIGTSSFEAWIKTSNKTDWMTLINTHGAECPYWGIELNGTNRRDGLEIIEGTLHDHFSIGGARGCSTVSSGGSVDIFDGEWHHIIYTNDSMLNAGVGVNGTIIIYIDGVSVSAGNHRFGGDRAFSPFTAPVTLGARKFPGKSTGHFMGMIDEVRFYARPLTVNEVSQNFEARTAYKVEPAGKLPTVWGALKTKF